MAEAGGRWRSTWKQRAGRAARTGCARAGKFLFEADFAGCISYAGSENWIIRNGKRGSSGPDPWSVSQLPGVVVNKYSIDLFLEACGASSPLELELEDPHRQLAERRLVYQPFAIVGRDPESDIALEHEQISHRHAYLQLIGGRLFVVDLASRSGTFWESGDQSAGWLDRNQSIRIGPVSLRLLVGGKRPPDPSEHDADSESNPLSNETGHGPSMTLEFVNLAAGRPPWRMNQALAFIGRSPLCRVQLASQTVSKFHAGLVHTAKGTWIVDLLGKDGTYVNGVRVRSARLDDGDRLRIGKFVIRVSVGDALEESAPPDEEPTFVRLGAPEESGVRSSESGVDAQLQESGVRSSESGVEAQLQESGVESSESGVEAQLQESDVQSLESEVEAWLQESDVQSSESEVEAQLELEEPPTPDVRLPIRDSRLQTPSPGTEENLPVLRRATPPAPASSKPRAPVAYSSSLKPAPALPPSAVDRPNPLAEVLQKGELLQRGELSESMLLPLVNQFGNMQQQMFDQFHQALLMMVQMFSNLHKDQMGVVRQELDRLHELTRELHTLQDQLGRRRIAAAAPPPVPARRPASPQVRTSASQPQLKRKAEEAHPRLTAPVKSENGNHAIGRSETAPRSASPRPSPRPPSPSASPSASPSPSPSPSAQQAPMERPLPPGGLSDDAIHAQLTDRIAALQQEQQGLWQRIVGSILGKRPDEPVP